MYTLSKKYVDKNGYRFFIPCPLVPFMNDIIEAMKTQTVQQAFLTVAENNGIVLIEPVSTCPRRQYQYPLADPVQATTGTLSWFILGELGLNRGYTSEYELPLPELFLNEDDYMYKYSDARFLHTNTTKVYTYSTYGAYTMTYAELEEGSPLLFKIINDRVRAPIAFVNIGTEDFPVYDETQPIPVFTDNNLYVLPCICSSVLANRPEQTGYIIHDKNDKLLFLPVIHKKLLYSYIPVATDEIVNFTNIGCKIDDSTSDILYKYTKTKLYPLTTTVCYRK